jgi:hypothetical protein
MSHHFIIPTNENGLILDQTAGNDVTVAMSAVFGFKDVFIYAHGWWTDAIHAMEGYNRFTIEFSRFFRSHSALSALPTLNLGIHWPSTLSEDQFSLENYFQALSFYTMEKRADTVGSNAVYALLQLILAARPAGGPELRLHLLGHSFGCKVVCSALGRLVQQSGAALLSSGATFDLVLLQAAFDNDKLEPQNDYGNLASLPGLRVLISHSDEDTALGGLYPKAHRLAHVFGQIKPALGAAGPTDVFATQLGGATAVDVGPDFAGGGLSGRLVVADLTPLHQAHPENAAPSAGHHSDMFHAELYGLLAGFYFGV